MKLKSCKEIQRNIDDLRKKLQQDKLINFAVANYSSFCEDNSQQIRENSNEPLFVKDSYKNEMAVDT